MDQERQRVIDAFVEELISSVHPDDPARAAKIKEWLPAELPPRPSAAQLDAWRELGDLAADPAVRHCLRAMENDLPGEADMIPHGPVLEAVRSAVDAGVDPATPRGVAIAAAISGDLPRSRWAALAEQVERYSDARFERYWALLMILNGQEAYPAAAPLFDWFAAALRAGYRESPADVLAGEG